MPTDIALGLLLIAGPLIGWALTDLSYRLERRWRR